MRNIFIIIFMSFSVVLFGQNLKIKKIEYSTKGYAMLPDFELIVYSDKTIIFNAIEGNYGKREYERELVAYGTDQNGINVRETKIKGTYKAKLNRSTFKEISELIESLIIEIDVKEWVYSSLHSSEHILKVIDENNEITIYETGENASEKLLKLYDYFSEIRFSQEWK
jgi:hypothetical protein